MSPAPNLVFDLDAQVYPLSLFEKTVAEAVALLEDEAKEIRAGKRLELKEHEAWRQIGQLVQDLEKVVPRHSADLDEYRQAVPHLSTTDPAKRAQIAKWLDTQREWRIPALNELWTVLDQVAHNRELPTRRLAAMGVVLESGILQVIDIEQSLERWFALASHELTPGPKIEPQMPWDVEESGVAPVVQQTTISSPTAAEVASAAESPQMKLYGVEIQFDASGLPVLPSLEGEFEFELEPVGRGHGVDLAPEAELDRRYSLDLDLQR